MAPSKYHAIKVHDPEFGVFDSRREHQQFLTLRLLEAAGEISELRRQVPYHLWVGGEHICKYIADFVFARAGRTVIQDAKGVRTPEYKLKKKLMKACHGIEIEEV